MGTKIVGMGWDGDTFCGDREGTGTQPVGTGRGMGANPLGKRWGWG